MYIYVYTCIYILVDFKLLSLLISLVEMMVGIVLCQIFNSWSFNSLNLSKSVPSVSSLSPKSPDISRFRFHPASRAHFPRNQRINLAVYTVCKFHEDGDGFVNTGDEVGGSDCWVGGSDCLIHFNLLRWPCSNASPLR